MKFLCALLSSIGLARLLCTGLLLFTGLAHQAIAQIAQPGQSTAPVTDPIPECRVALRLITSQEYLHDHGAEIPDGASMTDDAKAHYVAGLFRKSAKDADDPEVYCFAAIRDNLKYSSAYHLPGQCLDFMPLLQKSFEDKVEYKSELNGSVHQKMDESLIDMLLLDETAPDRLVKKCEVGIQVMQVDLNDRHLKQKYPLPAVCEALFADMEKTVILPSQLDTIRRQRVLFAIENRDTPERLEQICNDISK